MFQLCTKTMMATVAIGMASRVVDVRILVAAVIGAIVVVLIRVYPMVTLFGLAATGWMWLRMAAVARRRLAAGEGDAPILQAKVATARFYMERLLPQARALQATIGAGAESTMALDAALL